MLILGQIHSKRNKLATAAGGRGEQSAHRMSAGAAPKLQGLHLKREREVCSEKY